MRHWFAVACLLLGLPAAAQFPERPSRIIVAFSTGTASHLSVELMRKMAGVNIVSVAYRATAQALNDTISGEVAMYFPNLVSALPHIRSTRLRGLAVTSVKRSQAAPEVPALGGDIVAGGPADLDKAMRGGAAKWGALVKELDAQGR
jgi:tripartite-type tricarboxylate transporter receptor subunit TctC